MVGKITTSRLRNVDRLEFDVPDPGAWLLSGTNGAGKTSLLACLRRIGSPNAFPVHFPSSFKSPQLDNFEGASIQYSINGQMVEYAYRGERWAPRPRKNSHLLNQFGYQSVIYIGANADRVTPRPDDFVPRRVRPANADLIIALNRIFETEKFSALKTINLTRGAGNPAFLLRLGDEQPAQYHSEKHFSLGELCIIKLIEGIRECPNNSLVLIDELEMALHPRAQIQLYRYLEEVSHQKRLTTLFSTHSVSLLKSVPRQKIIHLDKTPTGLRAAKGCFPTYAIGSITLGEESAPDTVLFVEDERARSIVEVLVKLTLNHLQIGVFPDVKVIPVGGYDAVIKFLDRQAGILPPHTQGFALLDDDVRSETVAQWTAQGNHSRLAEFQRLGNAVDYLPWTPEVAIVDYLRNNRAAAERALQVEVGNAFVLNQAALQVAVGSVGAARRNECKSIVSVVLGELSRIANRGREVAELVLCRQFALAEFASNQAAIINLLAPKIR